MLNIERIMGTQHRETAPENWIPLLGPKYWSPDGNQRVVEFTLSWSAADVSQYCSELAALSGATVEWFDSPFFSYRMVRVLDPPPEFEEARSALSLLYEEFEAKQRAAQPVYSGLPLPVGYGEEKGYSGVPIWLQFGSLLNRPVSAPTAYPPGGFVFRLGTP